MNYIEKMKKMEDKIIKKNFNVFFKSSEYMNEIKDNSVNLLISGSLYLGNNLDDYKTLFQKVYIDEGKKKLKDNGIFLIQQTNGYKDNEVFEKDRIVLDLMRENGFKLIDTKIWKRTSINFFQMPYSYMYLFVKNGNKFGRTHIKNKDYLKGIWDYKQTNGSELNSWNYEMCKMLITALTKKGDVVVDVFAGTCKILAIGAHLNRLCYGYEINKKLKPIILKNINMRYIDEYSDSNN